MAPAFPFSEASGVPSLNSSDGQDSLAHSGTQRGFGQNQPNRGDAAVINHFAVYWLTEKSVE